MEPGGVEGEPGGGALEPLRATLPSLRIGGSCLVNRKAKLSIKGKLVWPGQGGGRKRLPLVRNVAKNERERLSRGMGFPELAVDRSPVGLGLSLPSPGLENRVGLI